MNILKLIAQLSLDGTRFRSGLKEASAVANNWSKELGGSIKGELAAIFGAAAFVAFTKNAIASTVALKDQAEQSRMSTDEVQRLAAAAENAGLKWENIAQAEIQFNQHRRDAVESNKELRDTFEKYGMTLDDLQNPQLKFMDFLKSANAAMSEMSAEDKARSGVELADMLGRLGPKLTEVVTGLKAVNKEPIVSKEAIEELDSASKKLDKMGRKTKGFIGESAAMFSKNPWLLIGGPYTLWKMTHFKKNGTGESGAGSSPENTNDGSGGSRYSGEPLFKDKIALKEANDIKKAQLELEQAIFKVQLQQLSMSEQRASKEGRLREQLEAIAFAEGQGFDASKERMEAVGMLGDILNDKPGARPDNGALAKVGQWSGRNFVNGGPESDIVKTARETLGIQKSAAKSLENIDRKVTAGRTIGGKL